MLGTEGYISAAGIGLGVLRPYAFAVICDMVVNDWFGGGYALHCIPSRVEGSPGTGAVQVPEGGVLLLYGE